ncbi:MAG: ornithine cyclodeaminase family protein [Actinomycetota bacterium]
MELVDAHQVRDRTPWPGLIDAIADELRSQRAVAPPRHVHRFGLPDGTDGSFLLMPSWDDGELVVVKAVTYMGSNAARGRPTVNAGLLAFDGADGRLVAAIDGDELTARRTAAVSALATRHLARSDAARLVVVGTGVLAPNVARAHSAVRPIGSIEIWGRRAVRSEAVAAQLRDEGYPAVAVDDLSTAVARADVVSCVTGSTEPLVRGVWLGAGTHVDLVGSFAPGMRESDDEVVRRGDVFVDTRAGALLAGDLSQPIDAGVLGVDDVCADLAELVRGEHPGRTEHRAITVVKSAGSAAADLAATRLVLGGAR